MDKRCREIISALTNATRPITTQYFCERYGITARSIRTHLKSIDDFLAQYDLPLLHRSRDGISLQLDADQRERMSVMVGGDGAVDYFPLQKDRIERIILELALSCSPVTIMYLSERLQVSRSTIVNDLQKLRARGAEIPVIAGPHGFYLDIPEMHRRDAVIRILSGMFPVCELLRYLETGGEGYLAGLDEQTFFTKQQLLSAYAVICRLERALGVVWSDRWMILVLYAVTVAIIRPRVFAEGGLRLDDEIKRTRDYSITRSVIEECAEFCGELSSDEMRLITLYVLCAQTNNISYFKKENQARIQVISGKVIKEVERRTGKNISSPDELHGKLSEYLSHAYYRLKYEFAPASREILEPETGLRVLCEAVASSLEQFEEFAGKKATPQELDGITALFYECYYLEQAPTVNRYRTVVVTDQDQSYAGLFVSKLAEYCPQLDIIAVLARHQFKQSHAENLDFVITRQPLCFPGIREFVIRAAGDGLQLEKLQEYMAANLPMTINTDRGSRGLLKKILKAAGGVCDRDTYYRLVEAFSAQFGPIEYTYYQGVGIMLKDVLTPRTIRLNASASGWKDAVQQAGRLMMGAGCVEPRFVDAMVSFVVENGPYVVIAPGIAMPHARPEDGVKQICMSLIVLDTPIEFGHEDNDPVDLVIGLAATDNSSHLDALAELFELLGNEQALETIRKAKTPEEITRLLR